MRFWSCCSLFLSFSVVSWRTCCSRFEAEELGIVDMPTRLALRGFACIAETSRPPRKFNTLA